MSARFPWTFFTGTTVKLGAYVMIKMEGSHTDYDTNLLNNKSPFIPLHQNYLLDTNLSALIPPAPTAVAKTPRK